MLRHTVQRCQGCPQVPPCNDTMKRPTISREVGRWLYTKEVQSAFQLWCRTYGVRAYGNVRIAGTAHFARCLRARQPIAPGQAILTVPASSCFNYLTVAKEMHSSQGCSFPLELHWMNYDERLSFLPSVCMFELAMAGWLARVASLEDSMFTPYVNYLLQDTRGREGIANGIAKEREEGESSSSCTGLLDHYLSEMSNDACEEPDTFLEHLFRGFAIVHMRTQPIEPAAIACFIDGTNFFKAKVESMFVPTLMPLIDSVPQMGDGSHNTVVEYFPYVNESTLAQQCVDLGLLHDDVKKKHVGLNSCADSSRSMGPVSDSTHPLLEGRVKREWGFFALRALQSFEVGDIFYLRRYPRDGNVSHAINHARMVEAQCLLSLDNK